MAEGGLRQLLPMAPLTDQLDQPVAVHGLNCVLSREGRTPTGSMRGGFMFGAQTQSCRWTVFPRCQTFNVSDEDADHIILTVLFLLFEFNQTII